MYTLPLSMKSDYYKYNTILNRNDMVIGECELNRCIFPDIHYHTYSREIYLILEGNGFVYKGDKWIYTSVGDIHYFNPYCYHGLKTDNHIKILYIFTRGPYKNIDYNYKKSKL